MPSKVKVKVKVKVVQASELGFALICPSSDWPIYRLGT